MKVKAPAPKAKKLSGKNLAPKDNAKIKGGVLTTRRHLLTTHSMD